MGVPSAVREAHQNVKSAIVALSAHVTPTLRSWCEPRHYLFSAREKELDSLAEKIESGRYSNWGALDDLFACTVVVPTVSHEEAVLAFLDAAFERVELRRRNSTRKAPDVFRFDSTRWIGRVRPEIGLLLAPGAEAILFEVQVPTVFENAWSVVTHDLVYKTATPDWRKARLAAQLKAAVEQVEYIIAGFEANLDLVPQSQHPETDEKVVLIDSFKGLFEAGLLSPGLEPKSWSRFAENVYSLVSSYTPQTNKRVHAFRKLRELVIVEISQEAAFQGLQSGSLFQHVLGHVARGKMPGATLDDFVVVDSTELRDLHGVTTLKRPFIMP